MEFKKITTTERKCNSCGFVTFSLKVLYQHRLKCQGKLLGSPQNCGYCKRKFIFPFLLRQHKKICVKRQKRKKISQHKLKKKKSKLTNGYLEKKEPVKQNKSSTIICPVCMKLFDSRPLYAAHEASGTCGPQGTVKKESPSARKSIQKASQQKKNKYSSQSSDSDSSLLSDNLLSDIVERNQKSKSAHGYSCIRCRKVYPAKTILLKHLNSNYKCALAHFEQDFFQKKFAKARKSTTKHVVARKSFSKSYRNSPHQSRKSSPILTASARKSLPNSFHKQQLKPQGVPQKSVVNANECPVCHEIFSDSFNFYQHQKKYQHWGKATKTINLSCKCPFCFREFFNVRARNAHIHNHADQTDQKIKAFLESTTCDICSEVFISESLKLQHLQIEHSRRQNSKIIPKDISMNDGSKYMSLPYAIKQKFRDYPNMCPICSKEFKTTTLRNDHFEEIHLHSKNACQFCPIRCPSEELIDDHMKKFHYDQFKYECFVCKDKFPSVSHVVMHVKKLHPAHDPKNKQQSAFKTFNQSNSRVSHIAKVQRKESQEKEQGYFCDICNLTFTKLQFLRRHEQSQQHCDTLVKNLDSLSNLPSSPTPVLPKTVATPENISCSECYEEFNSLKDFVPHRLGHFGEKEKYMEISEDNTYTCEICGDVSDSHSKVQVHLFWHLQVQSSSKEKDIAKNRPSFSGRSSGSHVAKKSFGKQTRETRQEVVIGGIKKQLFTCELCKVGFTDRTHYNLHVTRYCRMKNNPSSSKTNDVIVKETPKSSSALSSKFRKPVESDIQTVEIGLCNLCCCIFNKSIKPVHDEICSKCKRSNLEPSSNIIGFKTSIKMKKAMAACLKCDCLFSTPSKFSEHMLSIHGLSESKEIIEDNEKEVTLNKEIDIVVDNEKENLVGEENYAQKENLANDEKEASKDEEKTTGVNDNKEIPIIQENEIPMTEGSEVPINEENDIPMTDENTLVLGGDFVIHCTTCNFIFFATDTLSEHEKTCTKFSYSNSRLENYTPEFKAALEENGIISSCLHCDLAFNNAQDLTEHLEFHQKDPQVMVLDESSTQEEKMETGEAAGEDIAVPANEVLATTKPSQDSTDLLPEAQAESLINNKDISQVPSDAPSNSEANKKVDDIDSLRKNFSQLLSILVSDPDLMQQLGYGELLVDEVLVNVLQTMEQTPVLKDEKTTDLDCLRKNIQILLDFCLEDQIMALIGDGKTSTDDIVVEALKIFGGESSMSIVAME